MGGQFLAVARLARAARVVDERDLAPVALGDQRAQHRHDGRDAAAAGDEEDPPRSLGRQHEVAADTGQADHHAATSALRQVGRDQPVVVVADRQLQVGAAFGVCR